MSQNFCRDTFQVMRAAKFCSSCGEKLLVSGRSFLPRRTLCARCAPRFPISKLSIALGVILIAAAAFIIGRYTARERPFHFVGAQVDIRPAQIASTQTDEARSQQSRAPVSNAPTTGIAICGAMTRSGKPCQRKVLGGGYCFQHRHLEQKRQEADKTGGK
jgi:hypothetical protein